MLVFGERGKLEYPEKNLSQQGREPTTNSTHMPAPGLEPGPHWWEASVLTTAPPLHSKKHTKSTKKSHWWNMPNFAFKTTWITTRSPTIKNLKIVVFSAKSHTTYGKSIMCRRSKRPSTGTPQKCLDPSSLPFWDGTPRWFRGSTMTGSFPSKINDFAGFYYVFVLFLGDVLSKVKENYKSYGF